MSERIGLLPTAIAPGKPQVWPCSVTDFFLLPKGQYIDSIIGALMPIERHITRITEFNDQLTQLRQFWEWTTYLRAFFQSSELLLNRLGSSLSHLRAFLDKKLTATLQPLRSTFSDNQRMSRRPWMGGKRKQRNRNKSI